MTLLGFIGGSEMIVILIVLLFVILIPLIALVDIFRSNFDGSKKTIWVIVVIFLNTFGAILYFLIGRNQKIMDSKQNN